MTIAGRSLAEMIEVLAGMPDADRAVVLDRLGPDFARRLAPHLAGGRALTGMSPSLSSLFAALDQGQAPRQLTPRALDALRQIARPSVRQSRSARTETQSVVARVLALTRMGGR